MKTMKKFLNRMSNADPMIWGYVMLGGYHGTEQKTAK